MATVSVYRYAVKNLISAYYSQMKVMLCVSSQLELFDQNLSNVTRTEVPAGFGYTTGGQVIESITSANSSGNTEGGAFFTTLSLGKVSWAISGGSISPNSALIYDSGISGSPLYFHIDFGGTVTVNSGQTLTLDWDEVVVGDGVTPWSGGFLHWNVP